MRSGEIVVSFVVRAFIGKDRLAILAEYGQTILAKQIFTVPGSRMIQFALRSFGSLVALLLHPGDFFLPFLK